MTPAYPEPREQIAAFMATVLMTTALVLGVVALALLLT